MVALFPALHLLDQIHHLPQLEALDPPGFLAAIAEDATHLPGATLDDLGVALDALRELLNEIDRFTQKSMHIRLLHELSADPLPQQLRTLLTATVVSYAHDLALLRSRMASAMARIDPIDRVMADGVTTRLVVVAERVLASRATLRVGVLQLVERVATARMPAAQHAARDRILDAGVGESWRRACIDLEQLAARPEGITAGSFAERMANIATPPEEPVAESTADRFSLLEVD